MESGQQQRDNAFYAAVEQLRMRQEEEEWLKAQQASEAASKSDASSTLLHHATASTKWVPSVNTKSKSTAAVLSRSYLLHKEEANRQFEHLFEFYDGVPEKAFEGIRETMGISSKAQDDFEGGDATDKEARKNARSFLDCIKSPEHIDIMVFGLLPRMPYAVQLKILDMLTKLVGNRQWNAAACVKVNLLPHLVALLLDGNVSVSSASPGTDSASTELTQATEERRLELWNRVVVMVQELGKHSVVSQDLQELFRLFWVREELFPLQLATAAKAGKPHHTSLLEVENKWGICTTLRAVSAMAMHNAQKISSYFSLQGSSSCLKVINVPTFSAWRMSFAAWVRIEDFGPSTKSFYKKHEPATVFRFSEQHKANEAEDERRGVELVVEDRRLVYRVLNPKKQWFKSKSVADAECSSERIARSTWTWVCVVVTKDFWNATVTFYVNGHACGASKLSVRDISPHEHLLMLRCCVCASL